MGLHRVLNPEIVLCSGCRNHDENEGRWSAYADEKDGAVLVRDVCAARSCPELQVRGHFCVNHVLQYELAWQRFLLPLRVCNVCCRDVLQLYSAKQDVWFICAMNESTEQARGAEKKVALSRLQQRRKPRTKHVRRSLNKTRAIKSRANKLKERMLALDWSLGNIPIKPQFLWKENRRRLEAEAKLLQAGSGGNSGAEEAKTESVEQQPSMFAYPDPADVFCAVKNCRHFAKTGDRCRFHSIQPVSFFRLRAVAAASPPPAPTLVNY